VESDGSILADDKREIVKGAIVLRREIGPYVVRRLIARSGHGIEGCTIDEWAKTQSKGAVCSAWIDVAKAIAHAHNAGVFQRDIKSGNVMLDEHGRVRLRDFGLVCDFSTANIREGKSAKSSSERAALAAPASSSARSTTWRPSSFLEPRSRRRAIRLAGLLFGASQAVAIVLFAFHAVRSQQ